MFHLHTVYSRLPKQQYPGLLPLPRVLLSPTEYDKTCKRKLAGWPGGVKWKPVLMETALLIIASSLHLSLPLLYSDRINFHLFPWQPFWSHTPPPFWTFPFSLLSFFFFSFPSLAHLCSGDCKGAGVANICKGKSFHFHWYVCYKWGPLLIMGCSSETKSHTCHMWKASLKIQTSDSVLWR